MNIKQIIQDINWDEKTELCKLMERSGSDKSTRHNYTVLYSKLFNSLKNKNINIFELGIGSNNPDIVSNMGLNGVIGASLNGWCEYFPKANIFAADIDPNCMIETDRIKTHQIDTTDINSVKRVVNKLPQFDIIIDDGLHEFTSNSLFLKESFKKLKKNGIYIVEDILDEQLPLFTDFLNEIEDVQTKILIEIPINIESCDNNILLVIK